MSVRVRCDQCQERYSVPDEWAGRRAKCKKCGHLLEIPAPAAPAPLANPFTDLLDEALGAEMTDVDAMADPFAAAPPPDGAGSGPLRPLPSKRRRPSGEPSVGGSLAAFGRGQKLITAVLAGMWWVFGCMLYDLVASGPGVTQIASGVLLVVGVVIVAGGLLSGNARRNRAKDKLWAGRMVMWMIAGVMGIVCTIGVVAVVGRTGMTKNVVAVTNLTMPFITVFGLMTLISGLLLGYYVLVLLFPKTNIFRIAGWGYVGLTVVIPIVMLTLGMMLKVAVKTLENAPSLPSSDRFDSQEPAEQQPRITPRWPVGQPSDPDYGIDAFGANTAVVITISNVSGGGFRRMIPQVMAAAGVESQTSSYTNSTATIKIAPVEDVRALAKKLRLGKVTKVDVIQRTITIEGDGNY